MKKSQYDKFGATLKIPKMEISQSQLMKLPVEVRSEIINQNVDRLNQQKITAYKLRRGDSGSWIFAGVTAEELVNTLKAEMEGELELPFVERTTYIIEPYETTQLEIDYMPEFEGW